MKANYSKQIIPAILIFLFAYTAGSKLSDFHFFYAQLSLYPYISGIALAVAIGVPLAESIAVLLLIIPATRLWGLYTALLLLVLFTFYLFLMVLTRSNLPCSCGGVIQSLSWQQHLAFNLFFILLSALGIYIEKRRKKLWPAHHHLPFTADRS